MMGDPGGGEVPIVFGRSGLTPRSPPAQSSKRPLGDLSPTNLSPTEKRLLRSSSQSPGANVNLNDMRGSMSNDRDFTDLVQESNDYLSRINEIVNEQSTRLNVANRSSIMELTQRITGIVSLLAIKSSVLETKLIQAERDLLANKLNVINNTNACAPIMPASYSDTLKLKLPAKQTKPVQPRPPLPCVVAYPDESRADLTSSSATKEALLKVIKPSDGFQIVGVKKTAKSGVVLRVSNESQIKKLQSVEAIKSAGLRLEKPKGRRPRLLIKDVPANISDAAFLSALYSQNIKDELKIKESDFLNEIKIVRRRPATYGRKWIGIELSPGIRKHFITTKDKLFIDFAACRFIDDVEVVRCLKCQQYGHVSKYCSETKSTCAICAEQHDTRECPKKEDKNFKPVCASCKRFKKNYDHKTGSESCPTYASRLQHLILNTTYG
jgi:hypothetical protein